MNDIKPQDGIERSCGFFNVQTVKCLTLLGKRRTNIALAAPIIRALGIFFRFQVTKFSGPRLRFQVLGFIFFLGAFFVFHLFSCLICSRVVCLLWL